jgi:hypothetical protein
VLLTWLRWRLARAQLYPNVFWNRYGSWFSVTHVTPVTPDSCLTTFDLFFKPGALEDTAFINQCVTAEDELQKQARFGNAERACMPAASYTHTLSGAGH